MGPAAQRAALPGKAQLWEWKAVVVERLAALRLTVHACEAQVMPCADGIPWLGFVVFPDHRRLKARKVRDARRRLSRRLDDYQAGRISFAEFDASVQGWINHVRYADSWGLRERILRDVVLRPAQRAVSGEEAACG